MDAGLLADASETCRDRLKQCNRAARKLVAEAGVAAKPNAIDAMSVDVDRLMRGETPADSNISKALV